MLTSIGKYSKSFFLKLLVGIIILPFVFWGMGDVFSGGNQNIIGSIDGKKISTQEFMNYFNRLNLNEEEIKNISKSDILERILSEYVGRKIIDLEVKDLDIQITDLTLKRMITSDEAFMKNKKFSRVAYEKFLLESNITAVMFEKNLLEQEKKRQLLSYLSDGIRIPHYMTVNEFKKENQIKTIKYIDLNDLYDSQKIDEIEIKKIYDDNKKLFIENIKSFNFVELKPENLIGKSEYNEFFYKKIDQIENDILDGISIDEIVKKNNLSLKKTNKLNINKIDSFGKVNNDINDNLFKKLFSILSLNSPELIKLDDKYFLAELTDLDKKQKSLRGNVKKNIISQIKIKNKLKNNTELVKGFNKTKFGKKEMLEYAKKNQLKVYDMTIDNIKDNKVFSESLVKRIFAAGNDQVNLITDSKLLKNFIIYTENTKFKDIDKKDPVFKEYEYRAKLRMARDVYTSYDKGINIKYKVEINNKVIDRIKNSF